MSDTRTPGFRYKKPKSSSPALEPRSCVVYFVSTDDVPDFPIKIGLSFGDVEQRLKSLQTSCPFKLKILATVEGTQRYEWILHKELHGHRLEGEWFRRHPEVLATLKEARARQARYEEDRRLSDEAWEALPAEIRAKVMSQR